MLDYAHTNGCPIDRRTCEDAAAGGHLEALIWLRARVAVGETVILLPPLPPSPLLGVSIWMERGCQQNDNLADS